MGKEVPRESGTGREELEMISQRLETRNQAIKKILKQILNPEQNHSLNIKTHENNSPLCK